ncbi:MAG TPA: proprotein convertase P-domain-containing protein [Verrucomicrobiales bacterium]|nr:proprotein convertase P-domain-containing protein [Verrucomicrobiales bacterium]
MNLTTNAGRIRLLYASRAALPLHWLFCIAGSLRASPPVILFQPVEQRAVSGGRTEMGVSAQNAPGENGPLTFQWLRNGQPVPGAVNRLLVFSPVRAQDAGMYQVVVRSGDGETWSRSANVHVIGEPPAPGTLDTNFAAARIETSGGGRATVYAIAPAADGGILIGGDFTLVGGVSRPGLARLTASGELDANFTLKGLPTNPVVRCLAAVPGGWLAGGMGFTVRRPWLAFIPADGGSVVNMENGWSFNATAGQEVRALLPLPDGRVLAGGTFTATTAGYTATRLLRLKADRKLDTTLPAANWNAGVLALARTAPGNILAGGSFSSPRRCLAQLLADGTLDPAFTVPSAGWSAVAEISALAVQSSGRIIAGGKFSFAPPKGSFTRSAITAFQPDGTPDLEFAARPNTDGKAEIRALLTDGPNDILIAGRFTDLTDADDEGNTFKTPWAGVARLDQDGRPSDPQRSAAWDDRTVWSLALTSVAGQPRRILAGGDFSWPAVRLTALRADAPPDSAPVIAEDPVPVSAVLRAGDPLRLSTAATAWPAPAFQWLRNGEPVPGATTAELFVPAAQPLHDGRYAVRITNALGTATSAPVEVSVYFSPPGFAPLAAGVSSTPLSIPQFTSNFSPVQITAPFAAARIAVALRLTHRDTNDISATLIAPGGQRAKLFTKPDPSGRDFDQTVFDDTSTLQLENSLPPFRGTYQTGGALNGLRSLPATGQWFLEIENGGGQTAVLESWQLVIEGTPEPVTYDTWRTSALAGLPKSAPEEDADGDGISNAQEWLFGPAPCDPGSATGGIHALTLTPDGDCLLQWQGWQSAAYQLEWSIDLRTWHRATEGIDYATLWTSRTEPSRTERAVRLTNPGTAAFWRLRGG